MADRKQKHHRNSPGRYYVDCNCLDHDACIVVAPNNFRRDSDSASYYVSKQPENAAEEAAVRLAMDGCPVESIGDDGESVDSTFDPRRVVPEFINEAGTDCHSYRIGALFWLFDRQDSSACLIETDAEGLITRHSPGASHFFQHLSLKGLHYSSLHDAGEMEACKDDPSFKEAMVNPGFTENDWTIVLPKRSWLPPGHPLCASFTARVTLVPLREGEDPKAITGFLALYRRLPAA